MYPLLHTTDFSKNICNIISSQTGELYIRILPLTYKLKKKKIEKIEKIEKLKMQRLSTSLAPFLSLCSKTP